MSSLPGFWMHESTGVLQPVVLTYLRGDHMSIYEVGVMRNYLRQWIDAPGFIGDEVESLRADLATVATHNDLVSWLDRAVEAGVDPF